MNKFIAALLSMGSSVGLTLWMMIAGWGLTPKSWTVIVWGLILQFIVICLMQAVTDDN